MNKAIELTSESSVDRSTQPVRPKTYEQLTQAETRERINYWALLPDQAQKHVEEARVRHQEFLRSLRNE